MVIPARAVWHVNLNHNMYIVYIRQNTQISIHFRDILDDMLPLKIPALYWLRFRPYGTRWVNTLELNRNDWLKNARHNQVKPISAVSKYMSHRVFGHQWEKTRRRKAEQLKSLLAAHWLPKEGERSSPPLSTCPNYTCVIAFMHSSLCFYDIYET